MPQSEFGTSVEETSRLGHVNIADLFHDLERGSRSLMLTQNGSASGDGSNLWCIF
jgi:hypothetical protein